MIFTTKKYKKSEYKLKKNKKQNKKTYDREKIICNS